MGRFMSAPASTQELQLRLRLDPSQRMNKTVDVKRFMFAMNVDLSIGSDKSCFGGYFVYKGFINSEAVTYMYITYFCF